MMKKSARQAKRAAKSRLSGAIPPGSSSNKKIVFGDDGDDDFDHGILQAENSGVDEGENVDDRSASEDGGGEIGDDESGSAESDGDDVVEEVKGSAARESAQRLREAERKMARETGAKKKRRKKNGGSPKIDESSESENESDGEDDLLTEDFFKTVDSERADELERARRERKTQKMKQKKMLGKYTTFVVEDEYKMVGAPYKAGHNIEVVALGGAGAAAASGSNLDDEQQLLISARLGSAPSKAAIAFARGDMLRGASRVRSSDSRKRKTKDEETWKRSRKMKTLGMGSRPGQAAVFFVHKR